MDVLFFCPDSIRIHFGRRNSGTNMERIPTVWPGFFTHIAVAHTKQSKLSVS